MKNVKVDEYIVNAKDWQSEMMQLRAILLACELTEELKWKVPCYTYKNGNIALIGVFKNYITISFFKGVLLNDAEQLLVSPGENSQSVKFLKFTSLASILNQEAIIKAYLFEAIEIEKSGLKVDLKKSSELELVEELVLLLEQDLILKNAFMALTPGRQRAYNIFFSSAKQVKLE